MKIILLISVTAGIYTYLLLLPIPCFLCLQQPPQLAIVLHLVRWPKPSWRVWATVVLPCTGFCCIFPLTWIAGYGNIERHSFWGLLFSMLFLTSAVERQFNFPFVVSINHTSERSNALLCLLIQSWGIWSGQAAVLVVNSVDCYISCWNEHL